MTALPRVRIESHWTSEDRRGALRCLLGRFRMRYAVASGLYSLGRADADSPVIVTGNYKLTFDIVRRDLADASCWILALDTGGIDVWSASAAGTFSAEEIVAGVKKNRLAEAVHHRELVIPRLAAPRVDPSLVLQHCGFAVRPGPVRSRDLPAFLREGQATSAMSEVRFDLSDRLRLTPREIGRSLKVYTVFVLGAFLYAGSTPSGVLFDKAWAETWPPDALGLGAVFSGSFLAPALLPWIPLPSLAAKGWAAGALVCAALMYGAGLASGMDLFQSGASLLFFPAASAFMTRAFSDALPADGPTGARRRSRIFIPLFAAASILAAALLALSKLRQWGLL